MTKKHPAKSIEKKLLFCTGERGVSKPKAAAAELRQAGPVANPLQLGRGEGQEVRVVVEERHAGRGAAAAGPDADVRHELLRRAVGEQLGGAGGGSEAGADERIQTGVGFV